MLLGFGMGGVADQDTRPSPTSINHVKSGSLRQRVYAQTEGKPQNWERWKPAPCGGGVTDP